jgi:predicted RND superfamily exporter protein
LRSDASASRRAILTIIILTLFTLAMGLGIPHLSVNSSITTVLPADHPDFRYNQEIEELFGANDELFVLLEYSGDDILVPELLEINAEIASRLGELEFLDSVSALSINTIFPPPLSAYDAPAIRERVSADPLIGRQLVGSDGKSALIVFPLATEVGFEHQVLIDFVADVEAKLAGFASEYPGWSFSANGHPVINAGIIQRLMQNFLVLFPLAIAVVMIIIAVLLRSIRGMFIPILVTLSAVVWTFGLKGFMRSPVTITESVIPVVLISIGCADGIHIVSEFFHNLHHSREPRPAIVRSMGSLKIPIILTSLTTALGFASFVFSPGSSLRNMGLFLAFGVMVAMVYSIFYIPRFLEFYRPRKDTGGDRRVKRQFVLFRRLEHLTAFAVRRRVIFLALTMAVIAVSVLGILNLSTDTDEIRYFKRGDPVRRSAETIERNFGGISILSVVFSGREASFGEAENIRKLDLLAQEFSEYEHVSQVVTPAEIVKYTNFTFGSRNPVFYALPDNDAQIGRLIRFARMGGQSQSPDSYLTEDGSTARITIRLADSSTQAIRELIGPLSERAGELFPGMEIGFAGDFLRLRNGEIIIQSQVISLLTTLVTIVIITSVMFRSIAEGLMVSAPVFVAVLLNFFIMWIFGVTLNPGTSIIASVGLGVGIDYSIHYFHRFKSIYRAGGQFSESLVDAAAETGRGILANALAVGAGFLILLASAYTIINDMGWIITLSMATTALASLTILPAMLSLFRGHFERGRERGRDAASPGTNVPG